MTHKTRSRHFMPDSQRCLLAVGTQILAGLQSHASCSALHGGPGSADGNVVSAQLYWPLMVMGECYQSDRESLIGLT